MTRSIEKLVPQFVEFIPKVLEPGVLYISVEYTTTAHRCACGCGEKVVLPLHPTDWRLTFDGKSITMRPSVGNWGFPCRSHYLITCNRIEWAENWSDQQISSGRIRDAKRRSSWHGTQATNTHKPGETPAPNIKPHGLAGFVRRLTEIVTQFRR